MKKLCFVYPHGGGGAWLANLIMNLENGSNHIPKVSVVFDSTPRSRTVEIIHAFEYYEIEVPTLSKLDDSYGYETFSMNAPFNLFLNDAYKVMMTLLGIKDTPLNEQFERLTCGAKAHVSDDFYAEKYRRNIALDAKLIYTDQDKFIDSLFYILDQYNIRYTKDRDYCHASIKNYRSTCLNPKFIMGDMSNVYWLSWCHALLMLNKETMILKEPFNFVEAQNLTEIANALLPVQEQCLELTKQYYFEWNE